MFDNLPPEILQVIIEQKSLDFRDLMNLSSTSRYMREFILTNDFMWKRRYVEQWPEIARKSPEINDYLEEIRHIFEIHRNVEEILINLATNFMDKEHLSDGNFEPFMEIINSRPLNNEYIENYLREILNDHSEISTYDVVSLKTPGNLTLKFYSLESLRYLSHLYLENAWNQFNSLQEEDQLLEIGSAMLTQWFKPQCNIKIENVRNQFDKIADEVKQFLKTKLPNHPLFKIDDNKLKLWRNKNIYENKFSSLDCKEILQAMRQVICEKMDFCGNEEDYYNINNSFIMDVLSTKRGLPITLSIIYEGVARRLGVNLEPLSTPAHFLLRFIEHDTYKEEVYYVDAFNGGVMISTEIYNYGGTIQDPNTRAPTNIVIERMVNNLEVALRDGIQSSDNGALLMRSILELKHVLHPYDLQVTQRLVCFYMKFGIDTTKLEEILQTRNYPSRALADDILGLLSIYEFESTRSSKVPVAPVPHRRVNRREQEVEFAVGMVMQHKLYNYTCVIYGWDRVCEKSGPWKRQMRVDRLKYGARQPFYQVLAEDGSRRYAAQENLTYSGVKNGLDGNPEVGRFFTHFFMNLYVPNCVKNDEYPNDFEVRKKFQLDI